MSIFLPRRHLPQLFVGFEVATVVTMMSMPPSAAGFFFGFHFHREDGDVGLSPNYKPLQSRQQYSSQPI
jgi:hypothetical protein